MSLIRDGFSSVFGLINLCGQHKHVCHTVLALSSHRYIRHIQWNCKDRACQHCYSLVGMIDGSQENGLLTANLCRHTITQGGCRSAWEFCIQFDRSCAPLHSGRPARGGQYMGGFGVLPQKNLVSCILVDFGMACWRYAIPKFLQIHSLHTLTCQASTRKPD